MVVVHSVRAITREGVQESLSSFPFPSTRTQTDGSPQHTEPSTSVGAESTLFAISFHVPYYSPNSLHKVPHKVPPAKIGNDNGANNNNTATIAKSDLSSMVNPLE